MPDHIPRPMPAWRQKAIAFWEWWTGELARLLPENLASATRAPVLTFADGDLVLAEPRSAAGSGARVAVSTLEPAVARAAVRDLLQTAGETRSFARLRLRPDQVLVRRANMPAATEENLSQVIAFEMDRLTPFRADDVYHDERVVSRDAATSQIVVQLAVARREIVDAAVAALRDLGVNVRGVLVPEDVSAGASALDLLPSEQREERENANERLVKRSLWGAVAVLLLIALLLPAWQKREAAIELLPVVAKAETDAKASDTLARDLERKVADYNYLLTRKHQTQSLGFLEEVSRLLPDNTWVQQFDLRSAGKGREVQITGETPSSSRLIELLEQSTVLQNAAPRGPVTRGSQPGTERFIIAAEVRPRPLPELRPAIELAAIAPPPQPVAPAAEPTPAAPNAADVGAENPEVAPAPAVTKAPPANVPNPSTPVGTVEVAQPKRTPEEARAASKAARDEMRAHAIERRRRVEEQQRAKQGGK